MPAPRARLNLTPREQYDLHAGEALALIEQIRWTAAALDLAQRTLARRDHQWTDAGGHPARQPLLEILERHGGGMPLSRLTHELRQPRQTTHRLARKLVARSLVELQARPRCTRELDIAITKSGRSHLKEARKSAKQCAMEITAGLPHRRMREISWDLRMLREPLAARVSRRPASSRGCAGRAAAAR